MITLCKTIFKARVNKWRGRIIETWN